MRLVLNVIVIWWLVSIPLAILVGKFLCLRTEALTSTSSPDDVESRYWSVAELGGDIDDAALVTIESSDVGRMQPAQRELSSV